MSMYFKAISVVLMLFSYLIAKKKVNLIKLSSASLKSAVNTDISSKVHFRDLYLLS